MASIEITFMDNTSIEIIFNRDIGPLWWRADVEGLFIKELGKNRTIYPWKNIRAYSIYPNSDIKDTNNG